MSILAGMSSGVRFRDDQIRAIGSEAAGLRTDFRKKKSRRTKSQQPIRLGLVHDVRRAIGDGSYLTQDRIDGTIEALSNEPELVGEIMRTDPVLQRLRLVE